MSALRILKPTLAAAALEPNRRHGLLDSLILGLTEDRLLAELVYVARELGPPALAMLRDYAATLSSSGRTVRMAYGLMLEMLLHEGESAPKRPPSLANGYLAEIEKYVQDIQRGHEAAAWWAEKYWVESDPGSEYLAMTGRSDPLPWSPPDPVSTTEPDKIKALFLFRFQEQARAWGYGTLFGWSQLERWLTARKPVF